jgi:hypothetical protein
MYRKTSIGLESTENQNERTVLRKQENVAKHGVRLGGW